MKKIRILSFQTLVGLLLSLPLACTPEDVDDAGPQPEDVSVDADVQNDTDGGVSADVSVTDAGNLCEGLDPLLGSLTLGEGFEVLGTRTFDSLAALAVSADGSELYGVEFGGDLYDYADFDTEVERVLVGNVLPDVPAGDEFLSAHLSVMNDGPVGGFTAGFDAATGVFAGELALFGNDTTRFNAPSNFDAVRYDDNIILSNGAGGLDLLANGIVAINLDTETAFVVSTFDESWLASSGFLALTSSGFGIFGGYYSPDDSPANNRLRAAVPGAVDAAVSLNQPIDMTTLPEFAAYGMLDVAALGDSVAILKGDFGAPAFGIVAHALSENNGEAVVGPEENVLTLNDTCSSIGALAHDDDALLVTVVTGGETQLLRIGRAE